MKENKNQILNQHSALTTFKLKKGKYYKVGVEKSIFALLLRAQKDIKKKFKEIYSENLRILELNEELIDNIINQTLSNKEANINLENIKKEKLIDISEKIIEYKQDQLIKQTSDNIELLKLSKEIEEMALTKVANSKKQLFINDFDKKEILDEIKNFSKSLAIDSYIDAKTIDFTILVNKIKANGTVLKKEIKKAIGTVLEFNYINKKNLDIEITSSLISSVRFTHDKKNNMTWMTYQIPREILELLLMPKMYVPLDGLVVTEIAGQYTYRMYSLFKDHIKRGWVEISKEELFNFFDLPQSYQNKTNLKNKFLEPTIKEVRKVSGIKSEYTFLPQNSWKNIRFDFRVVEKIDTEEINIIAREEKITIWENKNIMNAIDKCKKNIFVSKYWNKRMDNKINKIYMKEGEDYGLFILNELYEGLHSEIETTLVQYINGIIKNKPKNKFINEIEEISKHIIEAEIIEKPEEKLLTNFENIIYSMYQKMKDEERIDIEKKAENLYKNQVEIKEISGIHKKIFESSKKSLIIEIIKGEH